MKNNNWIPEFKSKFKKELSDFIVYKRSNGYKYGKNACYHLIKLDNYFLSLKDESLVINQDIIDGWIKQCNENNKSTTKARYYSIISTFCYYLRINGYENIIQPESNNIKFKSKFIPYIFTDEEIKKIFNNIQKKIKDNNNIENEVFYILISLYYCCGLRRTEALDLTINDYDSQNKTLTILDGKNNVSRIIPLNNSLNDLISKYLEHKTFNTDYLFITKNGFKYERHKLYEEFHKVLKEEKIPVRYDGKRQRIHDLRHTFAVNALRQMQEKGFDLYTSLPVLSVYLGHKNITETEYYLRLIQKDAENVSVISNEYLTSLYNQKEEFYNEK